MAISVGDRVPSCELSTMGANGVEKVTSDEFFGGRRVVLFAVPGAFTPTCSAKHLPGFVENHAKILDKGVDVVACVSVNDVFVMNAWGKSANAGDIVMLADGNGDFAKALGLEMDARGFGMGMRSQRFALVADDGVVEHVWVEQPGEFRVSSAEAVLAQL